MTKLITPDKYYQAYAFFNLACEKQAEVRKYESMLREIVGDGKISDMIYDPSIKGTKAEYDKLVSEMGIMVEWKPAENKFAKMERKEEKGRESK